MAAIEAHTPSASSIPKHSRGTCGTDGCAFPCSCWSAACCGDASLASAISSDRCPTRMPSRRGPCAGCGDLSACPSAGPCSPCACFNPCPRCPIRCRGSGTERSRPKWRCVASDTKKQNCDAVITPDRNRSTSQFDPVHECGLCSVISCAISNEPTSSPLLSL